MSFTFRSKNLEPNLRIFSTPSCKLSQKGGPPLSDLTKFKQSLPDLSGLIESFERLVDAQEQAQSKEPRRFTFAGQTYIHIPNTETFTVPDSPQDEKGNPLITFTALQIMKATFPATRTYRRRITPINSAEKMFLLGDSARYKILRAVQLHDSEPPITPETDQYTPFFQFLSEGVEDHWQVQQQYSSCKWAAPKNEALATSLLLHYGWAANYKQRIPGCCIYQMRRAADGIHLILSEPHPYNERLFAACSRANMIVAAFAAQSRTAPYDLLFKEACRVFFSYNGYYVSITSSYRQAILNKIQAHCLHLTNAISIDTPPIPQIEEPEPENCIPVEYDEYDQPLEYILKWEDFIFEDSASSIQQQHLERVASDKNLAALLEGWKRNNLDPDGEYTNAELLQYFSSKCLTAARNNNFLFESRKEGRKKYWKLNNERS